MVELPTTGRFDDPTPARTTKVQNQIAGSLVDDKNPAKHVMALVHRDYEVFRGDPAALPREMAEVYGDMQLPPDVLRVAKMHEQVIGCYAMHSLESSHSDGKPGLFELGMVMVLDTYQRNGVGRWLIGHAIGVAESKGGRELLVTLPGPADFFQGLGFRQVPSGFLYEMRPE